MKLVTYNTKRKWAVPNGQNSTRHWLSRLVLDQGWTVDPNDTVNSYTEISTVPGGKRLFLKVGNTPIGGFGWFPPMRLAQDGDNTSSFAADFIGRVAFSTLGGSSFGSICRLTVDARTGAVDIRWVWSGGNVQNVIYPERDLLLASFPSTTDPSFAGTFDILTSLSGAKARLQNRMKV